MNGIDSVPALRVYSVVGERPSYREIATRAEWCHSELPDIGPHMALCVPAPWPFIIGHGEHLDEELAQTSGVREGFLEELSTKLQPERGGEEGLPGRGSSVRQSTETRSCKKLKPGWG